MDPRRLAMIVSSNLKYQHEWTDVIMHDEFPRPLVAGIPPRRLYTHPDDQLAALAREEATGMAVELPPETEWVVPVHISENWSLAQFAGVFDTLPRNGPREKRFLLATIHNDSTIVYYLMQEGMTRPRQN